MTLFFSNLGKALIHVVGYGLLSAGTSKLLLQALESHKFNIVIVDESHYLKTRRAARTQRLHQLCKKAKHAILLSGTPSLARPREVCWFCPAIELLKAYDFLTSQYARNYFYTISFLFPAVFPAWHCLSRQVWFLQ